MLVGSQPHAPGIAAALPAVRCSARFVQNERVLNRVHDQLLARGDRRAIRSIDAEWLVDNFYIIEDSLREVRRDLPPGYDEQLPKLARAAAWRLSPRLCLALAIVAHTDSELDETRIVRFVRAFQEVAPLTIGELWALPTMLRLVLLENLRRLAEKMVWEWDEQQRADRWANDAIAGYRRATQGRRSRQHRRIHRRASVN